MKIGQFSDTFLPIVDGVGRVVYNYAAALARRGEECYVIAPMADGGYRGGYPFELVDFVSMELPRQKQYSTGIPQLDGHYDARMRCIDLDIIHAHAPFISGLEAQRLGRRRNVPVIGMFHSRYYDDFYQLTRAEMLANLAVATIVNFYLRCDEVWTVSQSSAETLFDYGYNGEIVIMPNGTPDVSPSEANAAAARTHFQLPQTPILLYCGQMNWKKNILRILESCACLKQKGEAFTLVFAGQGPDAIAIQQKAAEFDLAERTMYTGHITDENAALRAVSMRGSVCVPFAVRYFRHGGAGSGCNGDAQRRGARQRHGRTDPRRRKRVFMRGYDREPLRRHSAHADRSGDDAAGRQNRAKDDLRLLGRYRRPRGRALRTADRSV